MIKVNIKYKNGTYSTFSAESIEEIIVYVEFYLKNFVNKIDVIYINNVEKIMKKEVVEL